MFASSKNGCACGETSEHAAAINRSSSAYIWGDVPTQEIENNIIWLDIQRRNISNQIDTLKRIKKDRERAKKWRDDINALARQFYDDDSLDMDIETRIKIIQQRLGCEFSQAKAIADNVQSWTKEKRRKIRDENICYEYRNGIAAVTLAKKHNISRQQVHNIVKRDEKIEYLRRRARKAA